MKMAAVFVRLPGRVNFLKVDGSGVTAPQAQIPATAAKLSTR
jgi:hypothetical protein